MGRLLRYAWLIPAWTLAAALGVAIAVAFLGWPLLLPVLGVHAHKVVLVEVFWLPLGSVVLCHGDFRISLRRLLINTLLLPALIVAVALAIAATAAHLGWPLLADLGLHGHITVAGAVVEVVWLPLAAAIFFIEDLQISLRRELRQRPWRALRTVFLCWLWQFFLLFIWPIAIADPVTWFSWPLLAGDAPKRPSVLAWVVLCVWLPFAIWFFVHSLLRDF
jgi:hypothetical protein